MSKMIDIDFDFQEEAGWRDSDRYSPTLQEYHRILWSKLLPSGKLFTLKKISQNRLYHKSELGEYILSSDRAVTVFRKQKQLFKIISLIPESEFLQFRKLSDTIGGIVIWPSNRIDGKMTINGSRGFNRSIADRFDLTIECVRRYYLGEDNPLDDTFKRYSDFFMLFKDFKSYVEFFLLQDIVTDDFLAVKIATPFDNFRTSPIPGSFEQYLIYKDNTTKFLKARNSRIAKWACSHLVPNV